MNTDYTNTIPLMPVKATYASVSKFFHDGNETFQLPWATSGVAILEVNAIVVKEALVTVGMWLHTHAINTQFITTLNYNLNLLLITYSLGKLTIGKNCHTLDQKRAPHSQTTAPLLSQNAGHGPHYK